MKTKFLPKKHFSKKFLVVFLAGITLLFISATQLDFSVFYNVPPAGHSVQPLDNGINWGPTQTIRAFFPAEANLQWLSGASGYTHEVGGAGSMEDHPGASSVRNGNLDCKTCHLSGLEDGSWATLLPETEVGIPGKVPYKDIEVQAAFDASYLYVKASWQTSQPRPGVTHQLWQYSGSAWSKSKSLFKDDIINDPSSLTNGQFFSCEDRLAVQVVPKSIGDTLKAFGSAGMSFNQAGCFIACHSSMREMPEAPLAADVQLDPWLGTAGLNQKDVRHYLLRTRGVNAFADANSTGNWQTTGSGYNAAMQEADLNASKFIDLWTWRGARSAPMYTSTNDVICEFRNSGLAQTNKGSNTYWDQDPTTAQPANVDSIWYDGAAQEWKNPAGTVVNVTLYDWMYDSTITGYYALPDTIIDATTGLVKTNWAIELPLITKGPDRNAIPLNMNKINEGDRLPRNPLQYGTGLRGMLNTFSTWDESTSRWTVIFRRKLNVDKCDHGSYGTYCSDHKITYEDLLSTGQGLTIAFGVFDDNVEVRYHHVTFPFTLREGVDADIVANNLITGTKPIDSPQHALGQNYPNPFSNLTDIPFTLAKGEMVKLEVFDMQGKLVTTLINGYRSAGDYTARWNTQNMSKGVYIYKLQAGDFVKTKQAVLK